MCALLQLRIYILKRKEVVEMILFMDMGLRVRRMSLCKYYVLTYVYGRLTTA